MGSKHVRYSSSTAAYITEQMALGRTVRDICRQSNMPDRTTIKRWCDDHPDFAAMCARATLLRADAYADRIKRLADRTTPDNAKATKVQISAYQWLASKLDKATYGDALRVETLDVNTASREELMAMLQQLASGGAPIPPILLEAKIVDDYEDDMMDLV